MFACTDASQVATVSLVQNFAHLGWVFIPAQLITGCTRPLKIGRRCENNVKIIKIEQNIKKPIISLFTSFI